MQLGEIRQTESTDNDAKIFGLCPRMHTLSFKVRFLTCQATTQTDWWPSVLFRWHISQMTLSMLTENLHWRKSVRLSCLAAHSSKSAISDPIAQLFFIFNLYSSSTIKGPHADNGCANPNFTVPGATFITHSLFQHTARSQCSGSNITTVAIWGVTNTL